MLFAYQLDPQIDLGAFLSFETEILLVPLLITVRECVQSYWIGDASYKNKALLPRCIWIHAADTMEDLQMKLINLYLPCIPG